MDRLRELRKAKKMTTTELGEVMGVANQTITHYELGDRKPTPEMLIKLANFFNVSVDYLIGHNAITPEERAAGATETIKKSITPKEDELLYLFRCLSDPLQDSLLSVARTLSGQPGESNLHKKA